MTDTTDRPYQRFEFQWQDFAIEVLYFIDWSPAYREVYGYGIAHLQITAIRPEREALPITGTDYRSHFDRADTIEAAGGPVAFVQAWLDEAALSPAWIEQQAARRQLSLF